MRWQWGECRWVVSREDFAGDRRRVGREVLVVRVRGQLGKVLHSDLLVGSHLVVLLRRAGQAGRRKVRRVDLECLAGRGSLFLTRMLHRFQKTGLQAMWMQAWLTT